MTTNLAGPKLHSSMLACVYMCIDNDDTYTQYSVIDVILEPSIIPLLSRGCFLASLHVLCNNVREQSFQMIMKVSYDRGMGELGSCRITCIHIMKHSIPDTLWKGSVPNRVVSSFEDLKCNVGDNASCPD